MEPAELHKAKSFMFLYKTQAFSVIESFLKKNALIDSRDSYLLKNFSQINRDQNNIWLDMPKLTLTSTHMSALRNIRPTNAQVASIDLSIKFGIKEGKIFSDATFLIKSKDANTKYCAFHFDTLHLPSGSNTNRFAHPVHHFQFGGKNLSNYGFSSNETYYGRLLFLDTPRITSPPMDLSLALHFIFTNFLPYDKYFIGDSPEFLSLIKNAQSFLWGPFYRSISRHWSNPPSQSAKGYLPQIIG
jgi:hypothetical protein